jgi:hypothetical protein
MKTAVTSILLCALIAGCAGTPPKPAKCVGTFHPVQGQQALGQTDAMTLAKLCEGGHHGNQS